MHQLYSRVGLVGNAILERVVVIVIIICELCAVEMQGRLGVTVIWLWYFLNNFIDAIHSTAGNCIKATFYIFTVKCG